MKKLLNLSLRRKGMFRAFVSRIALCFALMMSTLSAVAGEPVQPEGKGEPADPYVIVSAENLLWLVQNTAGFTAVLAQDIDLSSVCHPADPAKNIEEVSWPRGEFYIQFDGQDHTIKNLYINYHFESATAYSVGLFGELKKNSKVKNLHLENVNINVTFPTSGAFYYSTGAIVGFAPNSSIYGCSVTGSIHTDKGYVGGIVGRSHNGSISANLNEANITTDYGYAGGIAGYYSDESLAEIGRCENRGNITSLHSKAGGVVGYRASTETSRIVYLSFKDCLNLGDVSAEVDAGGIVGYTTHGPTFFNCVNGGNISGQNAGYLVGDNPNKTSGYYQYCGLYPGVTLYANGEYVDPSSTDDNLRYFTEDELKSGAATYYLQDNRTDYLYWKQKLGVDMQPQLCLVLEKDNWDGLVVRDDAKDCAGHIVMLSETYRNANGYTYPTLPHQYVDDYCKVCGNINEPEFVDGHYVVKSSGNLVWFSKTFNADPSKLKSKDVILSADIDFDKINEYLKNGWTSIASGALPYTGRFNGNNHTISNLKYDNAKDTQHLGGLFKTISNAEIKNLELSGSSTCGSTGLLAYNAVSSEIYHCIVRGLLTCRDDNAGGMVAMANNTSFTLCASYVDVTGQNVVGGLIGKSGDRNALHWCATYGTLKGKSNVGGLMGTQMDNDGFNNCLCYAPHAEGFTGYYYTACESDLQLSGEMIEQTQQQMNSCSTLEALNDYITWFQEAQDVAPVLVELEGYRHYYLNCLDEEIPSEMYGTRDDSEKRYHNGDGHEITHGGCVTCGFMNPDAEGWYRVSTPKNLLWLDKHFQPGDEYHIRQMADIDLSSVCHAGNRFTMEVNWKPILTGCYGIYDGQGHTIKGLYISNASMHEPGPASFFGFAGVDGSTYQEGKLVLVKDLTIEGKLTTKRAAGMFASDAHLATFQNCTARGSINVVSDQSFNYAGGICGRNRDGRFVECKNEATIEATAKQQAGHYFGGIAGLNGNFYGCSNEGDITISGGYAGGIAGNPSAFAMDGSTAEEVIAYCCNMGNVTGNNLSGYGLSSVGGMVGYVSDNMHMCRSWVSADVVEDNSAISTSTPFVYKRLYGGRASTSVNLETLQCFMNSDKKIGDSRIGNRTTAEFNSGKVAFDLGYPWGQDVYIDDYPVLHGPMVSYSSSGYKNIEKYDVTHIVKLIGLSKFGMNFDDELEYIKTWILNNK